MEKILTDNLRFVDEYGRERIFAGMNVVDKKDYNRNDNNYGYPAETFPFEEFRARGFNIIRLGFTWSAMEPVPGKYNEKLISDLKAFLDKCEEYGIYAYLDCHQDLYSSYCYGDGAPRWATITDEFTPHKQLAVWAEGYFYGRACHRAFDNFWDNVHYNRKGLQDYFADMWKHLAAELGNHPALFGYDFLNEPFPGADGGKIFRKLIGSVVATSVTDKRVSLKEMAKEALGPDKPKALDQFPGDVFRKIGSSCDDIVKKFDETRYSPFVSTMGTAGGQGTFTAAQMRPMLSSTGTISWGASAASRMPQTVSGRGSAHFSAAPLPAGTKRSSSSSRMSKSPSVFAAEQSSTT